ncbi:MAG: hypothetical protein GY832_29550 [Chloroflexi bacterium]|nr:hypothetical protein [Chloroflexota bacterium]
MRQGDRACANLSLPSGCNTPSAHAVCDEPRTIKLSGDLYEQMHDEQFVIFHIRDASMRQVMDQCESYIVN